MPDTFDSLRPRIIDYLYDRGIDPRKRFRCLNPSHLDRDPSMGFDPKRDKVHCFACGADYDLFDLLALDNNLSSPADALSLASERYGDGSARRSASFSAAEPSRITNRRPLRPPGRLRKALPQRKGPPLAAVPTGAADWGRGKGPHLPP